MNRKINHGSIDEILRDEVINPKCFEGGKLLSLSLAERVKKMEEYDPEGKKAHELAKKYRPEEEKMINMIPPQPNWRCLNPECKHIIYLKPIDEAPKECPKCHRTKILNLHLRKI